jgi:hypothetical protein
LVQELFDEERLNSDFLSILNGYVEMLNRGHPYWHSEWNRVAPSYVGAKVLDDGHGGFSDQVTPDETHDIKSLDPSLFHVDETQRSLGNEDTRTVQVTTRPTGNTLPAL